MKLPTDIENIIQDYLFQMNIHLKKQKYLNQIKNIQKYQISLCKYCRCVKIKSDFYNNSINCNHDFYLSKPLYILSKKRILCHNVFNFYCNTCNDYGFFFSHLHYQ
jgi:hypothetical protein